MKCYVMRDLLPNYVDHLNSEETDAQIKAHLWICPACNKLYEEASKMSGRESKENERNMDFLKQLRKSIRRRSQIIALSTCLLLLLSLLFLQTYQVPLSFDPECMEVEVFQAVPITGRDNSLLWVSADSLDFSTSQAVLAGDYETLDLIQIVYRHMFWITQHSSARTLWRDGEEIRVVYYCYTESLWDSLFSEQDTENISQGSSFGSYLYGNQFQKADYQPGRKEIYYLPLKNMARLDKLSDKEFDAQRTEAVLVWEGVI